MRTATPQADKSADNPGLIYHLGDAKPGNWTPFPPVRIKNSKQIRLQRAQIPGGLAPKGQILQDIKLREKPYFIREEVIGCAGTVLERSWQRTRWSNGQTCTWIGRRKTAGRIEATNVFVWDNATN